MYLPIFQHESVLVLRVLFEKNMILLIATRGKEFGPGVNFRVLVFHELNEPLLGEFQDLESGMGKGLLGELQVLLLLFLEFFGCQSALCCSETCSPFLSSAGAEDGDSGVSGVTRRD
jgi:hypothetical protein